METNLYPRWAQTSLAHGLRCRGHSDVYSCCTRLQKQPWKPDRIKLPLPSKILVLHKAGSRPFLPPGHHCQCDAGVATCRLHGQSQEVVSLKA